MPYYRSLPDIDFSRFAFLVMNPDEYCPPVLRFRSESDVSESVNILFTPVDPENVTIEVKITGFRSGYMAGTIAILATVQGKGPHWTRLRECKETTAVVQTTENAMTKIYTNVNKWIAEFIRDNATA